MFFVALLGIMYEATEIAGIFFYLSATTLLLTFFFVFMTEFSHKQEIRC